MYTIAIVDDEKECVDNLLTYLRRYFGDNAKDEYAVVTFRDGKELLADYTPRYDIIFLDIEMNEVNGMNAAREVRKVDERTAIIFVTRLASYALEGYEVSALDFMVKPVDYTSFVMKFKKALKYVELNREKNLRIELPGGNVRYLSAASIRYIETQNHSLIIHLADEQIKIWSSLKVIADELGSSGFEYCNRCYLVNLRYVTAIDKNMCMLGDEGLLISRYKRAEFVAALARFYGQGGGVNDFFSVILHRADVFVAAHLDAAVLHALRKARAFCNQARGGERRGCRGIYVALVFGKDAAGARCGRTVRDHRVQYFLHRRAYRHLHAVF